MGRWLNIAMVFLMTELCGQVVAGAWNQGMRNHILKIHNDYRKGVPGACGMKMMTYDKSLEREAAAWARGCAFKHQNKGRGENIAYHTNRGDQKVLVTKMAKMWYDEVSMFDYDAYSCGSACHYTQMVWSDSTKLGCFAQECPNLRGGSANAYFLVCFYNPAGNMMGDKPYKKKCGPNDKTPESSGNPKPVPAKPNTGNKILTGGDNEDAWVWKTQGGNSKDWNWKPSVPGGYKVHTRTFKSGPNSNTKVKTYTWSSSGGSGNHDWTEW